MSTAPPPESLDDLLRETLPLLDESFAKAGRPIHERPLAAARFVVEHLVVEIEGDTKDEFLTKPWFPSFFKPIYKWYERRYGDVLSRRQQSHTRGVLEYFGVPLAIHIPLVRNQPGPDGTTWVQFPKEVLAAEDPLQWLENSPPTDEMPSRRRAGLLRSITAVANRLRAINNDLVTADPEPPEARSLTGTVIRHLEKAAEDAANGEEPARSLAVWELQMACEKTIKAYLLQAAVAFPETHNLRDLQRLATGLYQHPEAKRAMGLLPTDKRVLAWRYSELPPPTLREFLRMYAAALSLCALYAAHMKRKYVFNNFAVQLRRPPWHDEA